MLTLKVILFLGLAYGVAAFGYGGFGYSGHGGYGGGGHWGYGGSGGYGGHEGHGGHGGDGGHGGYGGHGDHGHDDLSVPTSYKYEYGAKEPHTHDFKSAWEHGDGHNAKGGYELKEPDGSHRLVEYHADKKGGFHAHITKHGLYSHPKGGHSYANFNLDTHH